MNAREFSTLSTLQDLKDICGTEFELIGSELRLTMLTALCQFCSLRQAWNYEPWKLLAQAINSVPAIAWMGNEEVRERLLRCWILDDSAIVYLIQSLAERL